MRKKRAESETQPPTATFVTRLQPSQLPGRAARQLPDQSTTLWVESSSTDDSRLQGAQPLGDISKRFFVCEKTLTYERPKAIEMCPLGGTLSDCRQRADHAKYRAKDDEIFQDGQDDC